MSKRSVTFSEQALEELEEWQTVNHKIGRKIIQLAIECTKTPSEGKGKPEVLKGNYAGYCSRRITDGDRLIYRVTDDDIYIVSCKGHYDDK